ncbi:twin-arginine translocation signal domain-containing protein [Niveispirillum cyanobacteriorum]|uniref:Uncharacterized protein n=1 Tax=Niveispirillum cyanobacteriorum TaxID=1612173 RepID=A0A2K9NFR4_9PROT|nr:twin-arginine translocation signal domain-containing protein [Niveispirillum cyanobacteriorum]AUN31941.1 hypothetical protein C0V82_16040 [Niveispirillum cyanobacteriorum]GGE85578.1 hypothetical protein GCM10011317_48480 [Niveispirillum cyanobacteriorum]
MTINRRDLLGKALAGAATAGLALPAAIANSHPDAALLEAFAGYVRANKMFQYAAEELLPNGGKDADHEPFYAAIDHYADRLTKTQAQTLEGLRLQVRYIFARQIGTTDALNAAIYGRPATPELLHDIDGDDTLRLLWSIAQIGLATPCRVQT